MKNPVLALLENCGVKPAEFAQQYDFSRQAVDYLINGVYPNLSTKFQLSLTHMATEHVEPVGSLMLEYRMWRSEARREKADKYITRPRPIWDQQTSPFETYIKDTAGNRSRFAKDMKVPVRDVTRYARGEAMTMPLELQTAFDDIEFPWKAELVAMQYNWREDYV